MQNKHKKSFYDEAVSPVIGVLLMLVVTIIIAAVVSGFAGGLAGGEKKAPTLAATVNIELTGDKDSRFFIKVDSISEPIPSKDIKIVTSWTKTNGTQISGGNTTVAGNYYNTYSTNFETQPFGYGPGVDNWTAYGTRLPQQIYGNFTFESGTTAKASPYRAKNANGGGYGPRLLSGVITGTKYEYASGSSYTIGKHCDGMQAVLGSNWNKLRPGDIVKVKLIHIPSQKTIFEKDIAATGASFT